MFEKTGTPSPPEAVSDAYSQQNMLELRPKFSNYFERMLDASVALNHITLCSGKEPCEAARPFAAKGCTFAVHRKTHSAAGSAADQHVAGSSPVAVFGLHNSEK